MFARAYALRMLTRADEKRFSFGIFRDLSLVVRRTLGG
jgi:hypothetical protein